MSDLYLDVIMCTHVCIDARNQTRSSWQIYAAEGMLKRGLYVEAMQLRDEFGLHQEVCMYVWLYVYAHVYVYIQDDAVCIMRARTCLNRHSRIHKYIHTYIHTYIYRHTHTHTHIWGRVKWAKYSQSHGELCARMAHNRAFLCNSWSCTNVNACITSIQHA